MAVPRNRCAPSHGRGTLGHDTPGADSAGRRVGLRNGRADEALPWADRSMDRIGFKGRDRRKERARSRLLATDAPMFHHPRLLQCDAGARNASGRTDFFSATRAGHAEKRSPAIALIGMARWQSRGVPARQSRCALRSDDAVRRHRRAQGNSPMFRSIRLRSDPKSARRLLDASVDPTEARNEIVSLYATPRAFGSSVQPIVTKSTPRPSRVSRRPPEQLPPRADRPEPTEGAEADRGAGPVEKPSPLSRNHPGAHV
jgi:hypothetical protein